MARTHDVYLSSTLRDLTDERDAVEAVLTQQGYGVLQSYSADEQSVRDSCLADVASCAIYVGIVGLRYGHCPADPNGTASCSISKSAAWWPTRRRERSSTTSRGSGCT